ncbi:MAG: isoprenylcysteine carboxylmethyltransferase family protein [Anaerolineae bacterium]|nr:isoprenylcysteine carboxylmethyltransferase family protein [Anaerolineae bacterium]
MRERHVRAILALPFMALVVIPGLLALLTGSCVPLWGGEPPLIALAALVGASLMAIGLALVVMTIRLFVQVGRGTLAPWDATETLVVVGPYRYVRNPMISGVIFALFGESVLCGSGWVLGWALLFTLVNLVYIPLSEEKGLEARFGANYRLYKRSVPRWIPRLRSWEG